MKRRPKDWPLAEQEAWQKRMVRIETLLLVILLLLLLSLSLFLYRYLLPSRSGRTIHHADPTSELPGAIPADAPDQAQPQSSDQIQDQAQAQTQTQTQPPDSSPAPALAPSVPQGPFVALTFDDGPKAETTGRLLDGLSQRGVHATFFVVGTQAEGQEELLRRMEEEGHQIGLHTEHHADLTGLSPEDFYQEVDRLREALTDILGPEPFMLRPPYGMVNPAVQRQAGAPIILWSVDPQDWSDRDSARQAEHLVSRAQDGDILLLHDIYDASVDAALETVDRLMENGFTFVTVEELFAIRGITPENGTVYRNLPPAPEPSPAASASPSPSLSPSHSPAQP